MTLREFIQSKSKWFQDAWITVSGFFVDMFEKLMNGDFLDLTLWQVGFLLICIWFIWKGVTDER